MLSSLPCQAAAAANWPTRLHDIHRGGVTSEQLTLPLSPIWTHTTSRPPTPAWTESPAVHDYLHNYYDLKPRQNFDRCFDVAVAGDRVYFGSSSTGAVTCLAAQTGKEVWTFFTDGPVRFAPQAARGKVYVGSDDGCVYCLDAADGSLVWRHRAGPTDEMIWGNEHLISVWPVRTSVLVDGDDVYWAAGLFPEEGMLLCKRNAADGTGGWTVAPSRPPQGYLLASATHLFTPTGRTYPHVYRRSDGAHAGVLGHSPRDGGCWALLTPDDDHLWTGPAFGNRITELDAARKTHIAAVNGANYLVVDAGYAYYNTDSKLFKINRRTRRTVWSVAEAYPFALIKAGDALLAGGEGKVAAFDEGGRQTWSASVDGKAHGLAVAGGCLYVSTDRGSIHCFKATLPYVTNRAGVSSVTAHAADLNGLLVSPGGTPEATACVFWGTNDGGTTPDAWTNTRSLGARHAGPISFRATSLKASAIYYYRFRATNSYGDNWAPSSAAFMTGHVTIRAGDASASEAGTDPGHVVVSRPTWSKGIPLTIHYTIDGTATAGQDYEPLSGHVTLAAGATEATIAVKPIEDRVLGESPETVAVTLAPGAYVVAAPNRAIVTMTDNDRLDGWRHKTKITFHGYDRPETLVNFPALVVFDGSVTGLDYSQFVSPTGSDLRFTDANATTLLSYEIDRWDPSGTSLVWVQVPRLASGEDHVWAYWGNPAAVKPPAYTTDGTTWSAGYAGVWHLGERQAVRRDSTARANHAKPEHGVNQTAGRIGGADLFDGEDDMLTLVRPLSIGSTSNTVTAWVKVPKAGTVGLAANERVGIVLGNFRSAPNSNWELHAKGEMRLFWNGGQIDQHGSTDLRDETWHHLAWTRDTRRDECRLYIDGRLEKTIKGAGADVTFTTPHKIGGDNRGNPPNFHGALDEVRVSEVARSGDWLWACWRNQAANAKFVSYQVVR